MLADLPVFGIGGNHESGKTTLIEALLPRLLAKGLAVAVAKTHGSPIEVDRPGKDSDRFFQAGADVFMQGGTEGFVRVHPSGAARPAWGLRDLARAYDLVLVECRKRIDCAKVWLLGDGEDRPPAGVGEILAVLPRGPGRPEATWAVLEPWLERQWVKPPVYGCVLIGGTSSRMGTPKHLLRRPTGKTWLEHAVGLLRSAAERVAIVGAGAVPDAVADAVRLPDAPDAAGPLAGILAAMRWAPWATWLVAACDMPNLSAEALAWLLATRRPGVWATLPRLPGRERAEPLLAHYDFRARALLEDVAAEGEPAPSRLAGHGKVLSPEPPPGLRAAWLNVNTPADFAEHAAQDAPGEGRPDR